MGLPVVSTSVGAEGLPVQHGRNIFLADTPVEFAERTADLMMRPLLRKRIGLEGRALVESRYSWTSAAQAFDRVMQRVVQPSYPVEVHG